MSVDSTVTYATPPRHETHISSAGETHITSHSRAKNSDCLIDWLIDTQKADQLTPGRDQSEQT